MGGISIALGETDATPAFNLSDSTNYPFTSLTGITTTIVGDTTPKLGGDLNGNSKNIFGVGILTATSLSVTDVSATGVTTVGIFTSYESISIGSTNLFTEISKKTSIGLALALG